MLEIEPCPRDTLGTVVTVTRPLQHKCPFRDENDAGTVSITWRVDDSTVELHSLGEYLDSLAEVKVSHEDVTSDIWSYLQYSGVAVTRVETIWSTAGMAVTVVREK